MKGMLSAIRKKHYKLLISVAIIASLGFGMTAGLICGYNSLKYSLEDYVSGYRYPDAVITTEVTTDSTADDLKKLGGVDECDTRLFADTTVRDSEGKDLTVRAFSFSEEERQGFVYWTKAETEEDSVLVEFKFAESNGIKAGDRISFRIDGEYRDLTVGGTVSRPETLAAKINEDSWGINYDFGYVYVPKSLLKKEYDKVYAEKKADIDRRSDEFENEAKKADELLNEKLKELEDAEKLLDEKKQEFKDAGSLGDELRKKREELSDSLKELNDKKAELISALALLDQKEAELTEQQRLLTEAKKGLAAIKEPLDQLNRLDASLNKSSIIEAIDLVSRLLEELDYPVMAEDVRRLNEQIDEARKLGLPGEIDRIAVSAADFLESVDAKVKEGCDRLTSPEMLEAVKSLTDIDELPSDDERIKELIELLKDYSTEEIVSPSQLAEIYNRVVGELSSLRNELDKLDIPGTAASLRKCDAARYADGLGVILNAIEERTRSVDTSGQSLSQIYRGILSDIQAAVNELVSKRAQIISRLGKYGITEDGIDTALYRIREGLKQIGDQRRQAKNGLTEAENGIVKLEEGIAEIDSNLEELREQLSKSSAELDDSEKELKEARSKYDSELSKALKERSEIEDELRDAYKLLDENTGYDKLCNEFLLYFDGDADPDAVLKEAVASFGDIKVKNSYTYVDSAVKRRIDENLDPIRTMMVLLPVVFFVIVLIVIFLFMSMIIRQSRREIGILRALGFTRGQVRAKFCTVSLLVCVGGMLPGALIAAGIALYVGGYFKDFFPLPKLTYDIGFLGIAVPAAATIAVTLTAALLSTGLISRISPREAMSRQVRTSAKIPALLRPIIGSLRPMTKFSVTSLMRSKGRFLISTLCIAASATLILTSFSFIASKNFTVRQVFDERIKNDCQIFLEEMPSEELMEKLKALGYVSRLEKVAYYQTDITANGKSKSAVVNAIEENSSLIGITDASGRELKVSRGGIVLERHTAEALDVNEGGKVTVEGRKLTVTAISDQCVNRIQYISLEDTEALPQPELGCLVCSLIGDCKQQLLTLLFDTEGYQYSVFTASLYDYNTELYATYDLAAWIVIFFAVTIGFVIVLNTMLTNLHENKKELAILRTLGFQHREISRSRLSQSLVQFVLACLIGFPLGSLLARAALSSISTPLTEHVYVGGITEFVFTGGLILAYLLFSHFVSMRTMKKWDFCEVVKDKE